MELPGVQWLVIRARSFYDAQGAIVGGVARLLGRVFAIAVLMRARAVSAFESSTRSTTST